MSMKRGALGAGITITTALSVLAGMVPAAAPAAAAAALVGDPAALVNPFIGTSGEGNTWPGASAPFGMIAWSPTATNGDQTDTPVPNGYDWNTTRMRGLSLTHVNGSGCAPGAAGDVPILPFVGAVNSSPSADSTDATYAASFSHTREAASPGRYSVTLDSGVATNLAVTTRAGLAQLTFPKGSQANLLFRTSNSLNGSENAATVIDPAKRTVTGWVLTGGFCGRRPNGGGDSNPDRRSYYRLYFSATFDRPFARTGTWKDATVTPGGKAVSGGEGYLTGASRQGRGSGGWVGFDTRTSGAVTMRIGISYVSLAGAAANRDAELPKAATVTSVARATRAAWNTELKRIQVSGGTPAHTQAFYTALYHALLQPQRMDDVSGRYLGADLRVHSRARTQKGVYGTFSGWDQYRAQVQLLALLRPDVAGDMAQSMLDFAKQNGGVWDRWLQLGAPTHVMTGDPAAATLATWYAMGVRRFDVKAAFDSLTRQATVQNRNALSDIGCPGQCLGQRAALDVYRSLHYAPEGACHCWGGAAETLENSLADYSLAQWAGRLGRRDVQRVLAPRAAWWRNTYNPAVGYQAARLADGSWAGGFTPDTQTGFAQGTAAQYTWMVPQNVSGLAAAMGGRGAAATRLDAFFHDGAGNWVLRGGDPLRYDPTNEPTIHTPWLYNGLGQPWKTQATVRLVLDTAYGTGVAGLPGNDDLGTMSAWYVFGAMGLFPQTPGRAELLVGSPVFRRIELVRSSGQRITVTTNSTRTYIQSAKLDGKALQRSWLPESFVLRGGRLDLSLGSSAKTSWGSRPQDLPVDH
ncbi:MAG: GH92 family glycosyl hydrolase [Kineosporiaceae bacterium]